MKETWLNAGSKEFARLTQGRQQNDTQATNTIIWQHPRELPQGKRPTYLRICANYRPQKEDPYRVRATLGGNLINYPGPTRTPAAELTILKTFLNSILSTPQAKFLDIDLQDFYLNSKLKDPEYMLVPYSLFPPDIIEQYNIREKVNNKGMVLAKVIGAMYGLPQAGRIAFDELVEYLAKADYHPAPHTRGLFRHKTRQLQFLLVVDDFGIKFQNNTDLAHLISHLKQKYNLTIGDGTKFCGINLDWNYDKRLVTLYMKDYVAKALHRFHHKPPTTPQHSPHTYTPPKYGQKTQYANQIKNIRLSENHKSLAYSNNRNISILCKSNRYNHASSIRIPRNWDHDITTRTVRTKS